MLGAPNVFTHHVLCSYNHVIGTVKGLAGVHLKT